MSAMAYVGSYFDIHTISLRVLWFVLIHILVIFPPLEMWVNITGKKMKNCCYLCQLYSTFLENRCFMWRMSFQHLKVCFISQQMYHFYDWKCHLCCYTWSMSNMTAYIINLFQMLITCTRMCIDYIWGSHISWIIRNFSFESFRPIWLSVICFPSIYCYVLTTAWIRTGVKEGVWCLSMTVPCALSLMPPWHCICKVSQILSCTFIIMNA